MIRWSPHCHTHCLELPTKATVCTTQLIKNLFPLPDNIPNEYADLAEVFSKEKATKLPPHHPWDCVIDLLPNTSPPKGRVYPLSIPETKAMEKYIEEALLYGFIRSSTSPAASGFFFVEKKDRGLRPCIDYRALNAITVKNRHPLPLIPSSATAAGSPVFHHVGPQICLQSQVMNGRRLFSPPEGTTSTWLFHMGWPMHLQFSSPLLITFSKTS